MCYNTYMKECNTCGLTKPIEDFQKRASSKDGHTGMCKPCKRQYDNTHYAKNEYRRGYIADNRKKAFQDAKTYINEYLQSHPCVDCGENDIIVLEFDHIVDNKRDAISNLRRSSLKAVKEELKKCEVRCANCHRRKTAKQFGWSKTPL